MNSEYLHYDCRSAKTLILMDVNMLYVLETLNVRWVYSTYPASYRRVVTFLYFYSEGSP